jgi:molybdopterin-containing oxidoreductase family iron-sulfur binding subunit
VYCPYTVRYFNFTDHRWDAPLEQQLNPDVTVREKGVMEKCTFCVQRIRQAKDHAKDDGRRRVRDGEVQPACVQSCPSEAMVFGDRKDASSRVSKSMNDERAYRVLGELNTQPSVIYLKKVDADAD